MVFWFLLKFYLFLKKVKYVCEYMYKLIIFEIYIGILYSLLKCYLVVLCVVVIVIFRLNDLYVIYK